MLKYCVLVFEYWRIAASTTHVICVITVPSNHQAACRHKQNCNIREDWLEGVKLK